MHRSGSNGAYHSNLLIPVIKSISRPGVTAGKTAAKARINIVFRVTQNMMAEVSLMPDVPIEPTHGDYASGRDAVMDWVIADAERN